MLVRFGPEELGTNMIKGARCIKMSTNWIHVDCNRNNAAQIVVHNAMLGIGEFTPMGLLGN